MGQPVAVQSDSVIGHTGTFLLTLTKQFRLGGLQPLCETDKFMCTLPNHGVETLQPTTTKFRVQGLRLCRGGDMTSLGGQIQATTNLKFRVS